VNVRILAVGAVKGTLAVPVEEYQERARRYWRLETEEVPAGLGRSRKADAGSVKAAEEERLLERIPENARVLALTREGKGMGSRALARTLEEMTVRSVPQAIFVIGGAFGLGDGVLRRADLRISFSPMTLPHELARLVLAEQLYRAGTILRNEPYHKGP